MLVSLRPSLRHLLAATLMFGACTEAAEQINEPDHSEAIARVFTGLRSELAVRGRPAPTTHSLEARMVEYDVPGVSVAVADGGHLVWARGFGVKERGRPDSVDDATLFQAASVSKPIAATAVLKMVEDGRLDLDTPVNEYLTSVTSCL